MFWGGRLVIALCFISDPCLSLSPPCFTEEDRFSLEALQTIHKQMDDDKDGGIEVDESDEVGGDPFSLIFSCNSVTKFIVLNFPIIPYMTQLHFPRL